MNENINLYEILKGHEGETFYSPIYGNLTYHSTFYPLVRFKTITGTIFDINANGKVYENSDELFVFPSKDQRDWNKWIEEQKHKVPKTWSEYTNKFNIDSEPTLWFDGDINWDAIGDSISALFKIRQLIEVGYGGNITNEEWNGINSYVSIQYYIDKHNFDTCLNIYNKTNIAFHTKKQAKEFLKYPENIQLLKDYFMI